MTIKGMDEFQTICKKKMVEWYKENEGKKLLLKDVYVVWSCWILGGCKCLVSTSVSGDGIYAEYTFNKNTGELYEDVYKKLTNTAFTE